MRALVLVLLAGLSGHASVVGVSVAAPSLSAARVRAELPAAQQGPWLAYLRRSQRQMAADKAALAAERAGLEEVPPLPVQANSARSVPLDGDAAFYRSTQARHIGDVILSFQTPAGGWSKNLNMAGAPRLRGQSYATANLAPVAGAPGDFDEPADPAWHYVGTLDNDATNTELHFLAALAASFPGADGDAYRAGFLRGVGYLLSAQYPNGGWPQVWPLEGGYHDAITFNDDAVTESAEMLSRVAAGKRAGAEDYGFIPARLRLRAAHAVKMALRCILAAQVRVGGEPTVWPQQSDPLTLQPVAGRNFEPAALSSGESASVMEYLMELPRPSPEVVHAVNAAAAWMEAHKIMGFTWSGGRSTPGGRQLTAVAGAEPLWARYYSLTTGSPIFGDRDKTIHDNVMEISLERRNGYAWYGSAPLRALKRYVAWKRAHPVS